MTSPPAHLLRDAYAEGKQAALDGKRMADNPYDSGTPKDQVLSHLWDTGFTKADPMEIDYNSADSSTEEEP